MKNTKSTYIPHSLLFKAIARIVVVGYGSLALSIFVLFTFDAPTAAGLIVIGFSFLFLTLLLFFHFSIITPLRKMILIMNRCRLGEMSVRVQNLTHDEIGVVGETFNTLVDALETSHITLEKEMSTRAKELENRMNRVQQSNLELDKVQSAIINILDDEAHSNESLRKFQLALDNTSDHVVITNTDGEILYANKAVTKITGFQPEEILGKNPRLWGGLMDLEFYQKLWHTIKTEKKSFVGEVRNKRKNGEIYFATTTISPIVDSQGDLLGFVGVERDVTEMKNYQQNLENLVTQRTTELKASIEAMTKGYALFSPTGEVVFYNQKFEDFLGESHTQWTLEKIIGKLENVYDLKSAYLNSLQHTTRDQKIDIEYSGRIYKFTCSPVQDESKTIGVLFLMEDITERRIMERSRDEFFSIASHELRTPLTAIRGNVSLIFDMFGEEIKIPEVKEMLQDIHESSVRLIGIVNDFLNLSRAEMGKIEYKKQEFQLGELIIETIQEYQSAGLTPNVVLEYIEPQTLLPSAYADKDKVREVLVNLIGNALKFTHQGAVTVSVVLSDGNLQVSVADTGTGISLENQNLLFHKFQQATSSLYTRDTTKGTGLGLYISRLIIEGMGGRIWIVRSEVGKGSTFAFTLPIANQGTSGV